MLVFVFLTFVNVEVQELLVVLIINVVLVFALLEYVRAVEMQAVPVQKMKIVALAIAILLKISVLVKIEEILALPLSSAAMV